MVDVTKPIGEEPRRCFCSIILVCLIGFALLGVPSVYEELTHPVFNSHLSSSNAASWMWLSVAFPIGAVFIALHYGAPGPGRGKGWPTHVVAAVFGLVTLAWLGLRFWVYAELREDKGAAFESIWWLHPFALLWS